MVILIDMNTLDIYIDSMRALLISYCFDYLNRANALRVNPIHLISPSLP